jgi:hypothetical protein
MWKIVSDSVYKDWTLSLRSSAHVLNLNKLIYNREYFIETTFNKKGLRNYVVIIIPTENSCIKFNNNINNLQRYGIAQNYRILHKVVQRLSQHNLRISNQRHIHKLAKDKKWLEYNL